MYSRYWGAFSSCNKDVEGNILRDDVNYICISDKQDIRTLSELIFHSRAVPPGGSDSVHVHTSHYTAHKTIKHVVKVAH